MSTRANPTEANDNPVHSNKGKGAVKRAHAPPRAPSQHVTPLKIDPLHRALLDGLRDPVITTDSDGTIETASRPVEALFGYTPDELIGRNIDVLMPEVHRDDSLVLNHKAGETHALERARTLGVPHKDGHQLRVEFSSAQVEVPGRDAPVFVRTFRDITERERARQREASLLRALSSLGESTAILVHEIKNPLTAVNLALRAVANKLGEDEQTVLREFAARLRRLEQQLRQSLTFAQPLELNQVPNTAQALFSDTLNSMRPVFDAAGVDVSQNVEVGTPEFLGDRIRLEEVLGNLALNAVEMLPNGGHIHLAATPSGDNAIALEIEDDGPGIPDEVRTSLFRAFVTTKSGGTGLGLPICRRIIEDHGGSLSLSTSRHLGGACFRIELPIQGNPEAQREQHHNH